MNLNTAVFRQIRSGVMTVQDKPACNLTRQGYESGACIVNVAKGDARACEATLMEAEGRIFRLIKSLHLSRPENYLSIYQSGCNISCRKCHSWNFSRYADGEWMNPEDILNVCLEYEEHITLWEPRERATAWHAHDSCRCCGSCVLYDKRPDSCPGVLAPEDIKLSPQGFGPVRNIVGFTGGDLTCRPKFYADCARLIKERTKLWLLLETNGYGLTTENLDLLAEAGVDAFWLDIKAHGRDVHKSLTGVFNDRILKLPEQMLKRDFVLEVLSLYIPGLVEEDDLKLIAELLASVNPDIPFTILAFFPEYLMKDYRSPTVHEMIRAYETVKKAGLTMVRLGNTGVFARTERDRSVLADHVRDGDY